MIEQQFLKEAFQDASLEDLENIIRRPRFRFLIPKGIWISLVLVILRIILELFSKNKMEEVIERNNLRRYTKIAEFYPKAD